MDPVVQDVGLGVRVQPYRFPSEKGQINKQTNTKKEKSTEECKVTQTRRRSVTLCTSPILLLSCTRSLNSSSIRLPSFYITRSRPCCKSSSWLSSSPHPTPSAPKDTPPSVLLIFSSSYPHYRRGRSDMWGTSDLFWHLKWKYYSWLHFINEDPGRVVSQNVSLLRSSSKWGWYIGTLEPVQSIGGTPSRRNRYLTIISKGGLSK